VWYNSFGSLNYDRKKSQFTGAKQFTRLKAFYLKQAVLKRQHLLFINQFVHSLVNFSKNFFLPRCASYRGLAKHKFL